MDNNNTEQAPVEPTTPNPVQSGPIIATQSGGESNKLIFWLIGGLVVILLTVGGIYWYLSQQQLSSLQPTQPTKQETAQEAQESVNSLDQDLESVNIQSADSELEKIDQDLQNL